MNTIRNLLTFIAVCFVFFSQQTVANTLQCGKIATKVLFLGKDQVSLGLLTHNGMRINSAWGHEGQSKAARGSTIALPMTLTLEPGYHEFTATILQTQNSLNLGGGVSSSASSSNTRSALSNASGYREYKLNRYALNFGIEIKPNTIYRVIGQRAKPRTTRAGHMYQAIVKSEKVTQCDNSKIRPAIKRQVITTLNKELPQELQFRLDALTTDIQNYYKSLSVASKDLSLMLPRRENSNFGIVAATDGQAKDGVLLLAVAPSTSAALLGLQAQDKILEINGHLLNDKQTLDEAIASLREVLGSIPFGETVRIKIVRNNNSMELSGEYSIANLPEVRLNISM